MAYTTIPPSGVTDPAARRKAIILTGATQTIDPMALKCSLFIIKNGTVTGAADIIVTNGGAAFNGDVVQIVREDLSANVVTIYNGTPTLLYTTLASAGAARTYQLFGASDVWVNNIKFWSGA